jgi:hypothetical protein
MFTYYAAYSILTRTSRNQRANHTRTPRTLHFSVVYLVSFVTFVVKFLPYEPGIHCKVLPGSWVETNWQ